MHGRRVHRDEGMCVGEPCEWQWSLQCLEALLNVLGMARFHLDLFFCLTVYIGCFHLLGKALMDRSKDFEGNVGGWWN